ncbi:MAG TPA: hypothetical protein VFF64_04995 [Candidatus Eremiobacteraceae bacterium]|nr:hypothetical protein [Candidatus Eremiobacteraceae bacterium]
MIRLSCLVASYIAGNLLCFLYLDVQLLYEVAFYLSSELGSLMNVVFDHFSLLLERMKIGTI